MQGDMTGAREALKRWFGFTSFRPRQEEIIGAALAGRDVFAILPTGGGKSLCFQLPALLQPGLTVVVSPLIALMKDQVDSLRAAGVPATFLNSSLAPGEAAPRIRGLHQGEFRLLYVAPERLLTPGFTDDLQRWHVHRFAIDEAHCISEWGHDFRPEYRQLAGLRDTFPGVPWMALTATATARVQEDIIRQLRLRDAAHFTASFNRPNLTYRIDTKSEAFDQILSHVRARPQESGIVYCQARRTAESLAARLAGAGVAAAAYHAGLEAAERSRTQEAFLRDEVRVVCATIAFGMGVHKPDVRFVIHHDLPKNIESYYQETGRAGRDGLPAECLLLFSAGDRVKQLRFIDEKPDPKEREIARAQLDQMVHYAEASTCRRTTLLGYFGETYPPAEDTDPGAGNCGACDNCLTPRETWDGTIAAQKLLSCVHRVHEKSGFSVGLGHVIEVLTGADTEKIRRWEHQTLSTYNIGGEHSRAEWSSIGRELIRLGLLRQEADRFNVVEITPEGRAALKSRRVITLTRLAAPTARSKQRRAIGAIECDEELFEALRQLRRRLAEERSVPPYVVFSDVSLREMARHYPQTEAAFARINGVGELKRREYAGVFVEAVVNYLRDHPQRMFSPESGWAKPSVNGTITESLQLFRQGLDPSQIAARRNLVENTVLNHLATAILAGENVEVDRLVSEADRREIAAAFDQHGTGSLSAVYEALGGRQPYGRLHLVRALVQRGASP